MKFKGSIDINQPLQKVAELFADPQHLHEYQEGFVSKELLSGTAGEDGAVSRMHYKYNNRDMELIETITANRLPHTFEASYHHKHMDNTMKCSFIALNDNQTRYETEVEYTEFRGFMPKMMAYLFPSVYRKHGEKWMKNFKVFVEKQ